MGALIVTGTDTDVGKTVAAAGIAACLAGARYWKPVQAGTDGGTDRERVASLSGLPQERLLPEAYCLSTPASPHLAARIDGVEMDPARLALPAVDGPLVVEGAGGVLVPVTENLLMADLFARWRAPVVLVARTGLGTINHSLLSIEALRARGIPVGGILFSGDAHAENERIVPTLGRVRSLGRIPRLDPLNTSSLRAAMTAHVDIAALRELVA